MSESSTKLPKMYAVVFLLWPLKQASGCPYTYRQIAFSFNSVIDLLTSLDEVKNQ